MAHCDLYSGAVIAVGSMHDKHVAIGKPFAVRLGAELVVPSGLDTDCFGTFTGEVERYGNMLDAARAKAELAIEKSGLAYGLGSEGTFGSHPYLPDASADTELLVFVDRSRDLFIRDVLITRRTNYGWFPARPGGDWSAALRQLGFPSHGVVVTPNAQIGRFEPIKGLRDPTDLQFAIEAAARRSFDGEARVTSDMRAHMNPTRMAAIRALAHRLAIRIQSICKVCGAPGFGLADLARGLPCAVCKAPTPDAVAEIHRCALCKFELIVPFRTRRTAAPSCRCRHCRPPDTP
jgi:hypothetical protein